MKLITPVLIFMLAFPPILFADELEPLAPKVTGIKKGEVAPYAGVLLNSTAAAKIFAEKNYSVTECKLKIDYELQKEIAKHNLYVKSLQSSIDAAEKKYDAVVAIKNNEIKRLAAIAIESPNDNAHWWITGGFIAGVALTIGMFYVAAEVSNN
tara:strand:- start:1627 stop:2085 length:459 start_codon:yes stop_codon:yes gene_type:complete